MKVHRLRKGIRGKRLEFVEHYAFDDIVQIGLRFTDKTYLWLRFRSEIIRESAELVDVRTGNKEVLKKFIRQRG